jgi:hypothetical protein
VKYRTLPEKCRFLRQGLALTGLGSATFAEAIQAAHEIYGQFDRQFVEGKLEGWSANSYSGLVGLDLSNRYFTPQKDAQDMEHIPFANAVDPYGILEGMTKLGYVHGEENEVRYYNLEADSNGKGT